MNNVVANGGKDAWLFSIANPPRVTDGWYAICKPLHWPDRTVARETVKCSRDRTIRERCAVTKRLASVTTHEAAYRHGVHQGGRLRISICLSSYEVKP
jgi:hypothetical protein